MEIAVKRSEQGELSLQRPDFQTSFKFFFEVFLEKTIYFYSIAKVNPVFVRIKNGKIQLVGQGIGSGC